MSSHRLSRRAFLGAAAASTFLARYHKLAAAARNQLKIRDVRTMTIQGPSRTYLLVKVVADDGLFGVAEAYGAPGIGVKEQILSMRPGLVGKDPLEIDAIYNSWTSTPKTSAGHGRTDPRTT
jgi:L-alanine-DL-glutamate epimerase-like enolase superfamily enzyme